MGKRAHGRLVHEVRAALYRAGFMPARITRLGTPGGRPRPVFSPGFKVEKHTDGKSVRLFHMTADVRAGAIGRRSRQALSRSEMSSLEAYNKALDHDGFTRIEAEGGDRPARFSLWRRPDEVGTQTGRP